METVKISIIGAGVVGLAIARELSDKINGDIVVFEKNESFGQETSSRNSEVVHAGIYYPKDSLKSKLCLLGNKLLYEFCKSKVIKYKNCGKIIVSTNEEEALQIKSIHEKAASIGVLGLTLLTKDDILKIEPQVYALNGIFSSTTGIIDSHGLMKILHEEAQNNGVMFAFGNEVVKIVKTSKGYAIETSKGEKILSEIVINAAGLYSDKIARITGFDVDALHYRLHFCKGDYFSISGATGMLHHLVYPVPHEKGYGLGVHTTLDLEGCVRLGPDATYVDHIYYDVDDGKREAFYSAAKTYLPFLKEEQLMPDTSGMRPKLQGLNDGFRDFVIKEESDNGFPRFINLIGIESPGLTACLAIGEYVGDLISL
ncbi:hypothetical protein A3J90_00775 [candidate division WOR-1 bacterium RIFOXYC2_FULL_37_10]|nr:MAG: hypothetical protein A3J90_00775 [candidate division WOR-1 bacterium RIFOXYC2_FULL_37_10]